MTLPRDMQPPEVLRDWLAWFRDGDRYHRGQVPFAEAWRQSLARACDDSPDGRWWRETFESQVGVWRHAFDREQPTAMESAFAELVADLGLAVLRERRCGYCGESLEGQRPNKRFCNADHRRKAEWLREKVRQGGPTGGFKRPVGALT